MTKHQTPHQAAAAWQKRQARLLTQSYMQAWQTGRTAYHSQYATPPVTASQTAPTPTQPNPTAMSRALAPALTGLAVMAAQIAAVIPTAALLAENSAEAAYKLAIVAFLSRNAWRLAGGVSVIWAAEHLGYAQAADADGLLLRWELDPSPAVHHCQDCPALAALPPMRLAQWPTLPGDGQTACSVGCRCSLQAVAATVPVLNPAQLELLARIGAHQAAPALVAA